MKLAGDFVVKADRAAVFRYLTDPVFVTEHLPDVELVAVDDDRTFRVRARGGVSNIRGVFDAKCELAEANEPSSAQYAVSGMGVSSRINLTIGFELDPAADDETTVGWTGEATIVGRLASVGAGLIEPIVHRNTQDFVAELQQAIEIAEHGEVLSTPPERVERGPGLPFDLPFDVSSEVLRRVGFAAAVLLAVALLCRICRGRD